MCYEIQAWYDRSLRLWTCLWLDEEGFQQGLAQYAINRAEMLELVELMKNSEPCDYQVQDFIMTIFRHINGKLYTLEMVKRRMFTEAPWLCATPYHHAEQIKRPVMSDFIAIASR